MFGAQRLTARVGTPLRLPPTGVASRLPKWRRHAGVFANAQRTRSDTARRPGPRNRTGVASLLQQVVLSGCALRAVRARDDRLAPLRRGRCAFRVRLPGLDTARKLSNPKSLDYLTNAAATCPIFPTRIICRVDNEGAASESPPRSTRRARTSAYRFLNPKAGGCRSLYGTAPARLRGPGSPRLSGEFRRQAPGGCESVVSASPLGIVTAGSARASIGRANGPRGVSIGAPGGCFASAAKTRARRKRGRGPALTRRAGPPTVRAAERWRAL